MYQKGVKWPELSPLKLLSAFYLKQNGRRAKQQSQAPIDDVPHAIA
jgi:hypothetical protein